MGNKYGRNEGTRRERKKNEYRKGRHEIINEDRNNMLLNFCRPLQPN
jgi:hypothetical protein